MEKKTDKPTVGIIDSQSVKNNQRSDEKGFDAGKKVKGVKRHIVTDSNGFILSVDIHSAGIQDRSGAMNILLAAKKKYPTIQRFFADGGYSGRLQSQCLLGTKALLSVIKRSSEKFEILPIRWIVERTFAWLNNYRRLSKHYEHTVKSATNQIYIAMIRNMLRRLVN